MALPTSTAPKVWKLLTVGALSLSAAFACCIYSTYKPQRDGMIGLEIIRRIEIGKTDVAELKRIIAEVGKPGNANFVSDSNYADTYSFEATNRLLYRLHLAPVTALLGTVFVRDGVVSDIVVRSYVGGFGEYGYFDFAQGQAKVRSSLHHCDSTDHCVKVRHNTDGTPLSVEVILSPTVSSTERNRLLSLNTGCLSRVGGCKNARELVLIEETR